MVEDEASEKPKVIKKKKVALEDLPDDMKVEFTEALWHEYRLRGYSMEWSQDITVSRYAAYMQYMFHIIRHAALCI